jgi:cytochrome c553
MSKLHLSLFALLTGLGCAVSGTALAAGDPVAGKSKSFTCTGCHATPGWRNAYPAYREPKLWGQHAEYIVAALKEYQSGAREHGTMHAVAASLSDQDMADLAAYFASQPEK